MNLQQLYYFRTLAEIQHFTRAAKLLYITQPSLSKAIGALEESLGTNLFEKDGRNVKLTEQGMIFYEHVNIALAEIQKGKDRIDEFNGSLHSSINIASVPTLLSTFIPDVVYKFVDSTNAKVDMHIFQGFSKSVVQGVQDGSYDVGFCHVPNQFSELKKHKVDVQHLRLAVPVNHPFAGFPKISLRDLRRDKILSYRTNNYVGVEAEELTRPYHLNIEFNFDDEIILSTLVAQKKRLALLLDVPDIHNRRDIKLIPVEEVPEDFHVIYMIYSNEPKQYIHERFIEYVESNFPETQSEKDEPRADIK